MPLPTAEPYLFPEDLFGRPNAVSSASRAGRVLRTRSCAEKASPDPNDPFPLVWRGGSLSWPGQDCGVAVPYRRRGAGVPRRIPLPARTPAGHPTTTLSLRAEPALDQGLGPQGAAAYS
jgi:hypothetical protein